MTNPMRGLTRSKKMVVMTLINDQLRDGDGDDILIGNARNDLLDGGIGNNVVIQ